MTTIWDELVEATSHDNRVEVLDRASADAFVEALAERFVADRGATWWWESLREQPQSLVYDGDHGLAHLGRRLNQVPTLMLVVTDEASEPQGVVTGPTEAILALVRAMPFFEYAVGDPDLRWAIFDTHHNTLLMVGDVPSTS